MIVFVVSFLFCDDCFLRCWDSQNPCGARWAGGFVCPLWDVATLKSDDGYFVILALDKVFRCFPGDFRVLVWVFSRVFLGLSRVAGSDLFRVGFVPVVRPSGRPPSVCSSVRPILAVFFSCLVCLLRLASFSLR